jgi:hypothetical protein
MRTDISFVTAHFHDFDWTEYLVRRIREMTPPDTIRQILVINQDRNDAARRRLESRDVPARCGAGFRDAVARPTRRDG